MNPERILIRPLFLIIFGFLFLSGCSKHESQPDTPCYPLTPSAWRIAAESIFEGPDTTLVQKREYKYDTEGRLILVLVDNGGILDTSETYAYFPDKVVNNFVDYLLNERGLATSVPGVMIWEYDTAGYCIRESYASADSSYFLTNEFTWSCFNNSQTRNKTNNGVPVYTNYQYYDKVNTIGNENHGKGFLGRQNNTLVRYGLREGDTKFTVTYTFDSLNRVVWETHTEKTGYTYFIRYSYL